MPSNSAACLGRSDLFVKLFICRFHKTPRCLWDCGIKAIKSIDFYKTRLFGSSIFLAVICHMPLAVDYLAYSGGAHVILARQLFDYPIRTQRGFILAANGFLL